MQEGGEVMVFEAVLIGSPGSVTVRVHDESGSDGSSQLKPASLKINLSAGPMACLAFEETGPLQCGLIDCIGALKLLAVDKFGNKAVCEPFIVSALCLLGLYNHVRCGF